MFFKILLIHLVFIKICSTDKFNDCVLGREQSSSNYCRKINKVTIIVVIDDDTRNGLEVNGKFEDVEIKAFTDAYKFLLTGVFRENFDYNSGEVKTVIIRRDEETPDKAKIIKTPDSKDPTSVIDEITRFPPKMEYYGQKHINLPDLLHVAEGPAGDSNDTQSIFLLVTHENYGSASADATFQFIKTKVENAKRLMFVVHMVPEHGYPVNSLSKLFHIKDLKDSGYPYFGMYMTSLTVPKKLEDVRKFGGNVAHCMCQMFDDCQWTSKTLTPTKCHYMGNGKCVQLANYTISHQGTSRRTICPLPKEQLCHNKDCQADCELKGWTEWSQCWCGGFRERNRIWPNKGLSKFTSECPEFINETCSALDNCTNKIEFLSRTTGIPTTVRVTLPIVTLEPTEPDVEIYLVVGLSVAIVLLVVAIFLCCYCCRRQKESGKSRFRVMVNKVRQSRVDRKKRRQAIESVAAGSSMSTTRNQSRTRNGSRSRTRNDSHSRTRNDSHSRTRNDSQSRTRNDSQSRTQNQSRTRSLIQTGKRRKL